MNYYYDIFLNFSEENVMFYEWSNDLLEYYKKVPLFLVTNKVLKDLISHNIKVSKEFLNKIDSKTKLKKETCKYIALFADKNGAIALEFNDEGKSIARSFLNLEDELHLVEVLYTLSVEKIDYELLEEIEYKSDLKLEDKIKRIIKTEINSLIEKKDDAKLKYLYMEWFNKVPKDNQEIQKDVINSLNKNIGCQEIKIYNLIKLSYTQV